QWLLLIHQIPPKPDYLRVKIGRRLQRVGAVAVKNSVYVLPNADQPFEDFQWIRTEIIGGGGDASICRAEFIDGLTSDQIRHLFRSARDADYLEIAAAARDLLAGARQAVREARSARVRPDDDLARLRRRFAAVALIDFFDAPEGATAKEALVTLAAELEQARGAAEGRDAALVNRAEYLGRTWVTRENVFVDRLASAWLIQRFIDPEARFRFVREGEYRPTKRQLRFDTFEGEFTHEGDRCTFEVLLDRMSLDDSALRSIAEVVHDIDLKDGKFGRDDAPGIERVISGIAAAHPDDVARLERARQLFDELYLLFSAEASARAPAAPSKVGGPI
ncbi:MAG: chromate resistance protein ChrB domain-containing protein, partial [Gemmatimonadaceae bacterium]